MSNLETIKQLLNALKEGDVDGFVAHLADDVRWEFHPHGNTAQERDVPYMRYREGRDHARTFHDDILEDFEMHDIDAHSFLEGDGKVAVVIRYELTVKSTGKRIRDEEIHLYEMDDDGKVRAFRHFLDTARAIDAHRPAENEEPRPVGVG